MYILQEIDSDSDPIRILLRENEEVIGTKTISSLKGFSQISKEHCIIFITKDLKVYVKNISNSPGVFVNGVRVGTALLLLHEGDTIGLGVPYKDGRKGFICKLLWYDEKLNSPENCVLGSANDSSLRKIDLNCSDDETVSPDVAVDKFEKSSSTENAYEMPKFEEFTLETFYKVPPQSKKEHYVSSHEKSPRSSNVSNISALNGSSQGVNRYRSLNQTSTDSSYRNDNEETMLLEENVDTSRGRTNCNFQDSLIQSINPYDKIALKEIHTFLRDSPELSIKACNKTDKEDMRNTILVIMDVLKKAHKTDKLYSYENFVLGSANDSLLREIDLNCADDKTVSPDIAADKFQKSSTTENAYKMASFEEFTLETFFKVPSQSKKEHHVSSHEKSPSSSDVSNISALNGSSQGVNKHRSLNETSTDSSYRNDNEETMLLEENVEASRGRKNCNFQGSLVQSFNPNNKVTIVDIHTSLEDSSELLNKACNENDKEDMRNTNLVFMDSLKEARDETDRDFNTRSEGSVNVHGNGLALDFNPQDNSTSGNSEVVCDDSDISSHNSDIREIFGDSCSSTSLSTTKSSPRIDSPPETVELVNNFIQSEDAYILGERNSDAADRFMLFLRNTTNDK